MAARSSLFLAALMVAGPFLHNTVERALMHIGPKS